MTMTNSHNDTPDRDDRSWTVWRQGDDGNPFLVKENLTEEEADKLVAEFESRKHKQTYWTQRRKE